MDITNTSRTAHRRYIVLRT